MKKFFKFIILGFTILALAGALFLPLVSNAQANAPAGTVISGVNANTEFQAINKGCDLGDISCYIIRGLGVFLVFVSSLFIKLGVAVADFAMHSIFFLIGLGNDLFKLEIITGGFKIALDIANLGFVFALIFIAFSTILNLEKFNSKELLVKLIVSVILVNFSLLIAGALIDFSNILGVYFLTGGDNRTNNTEQMGINIMNGLGAHNLLLNAGKNSDAVAATRGNTIIAGSNQDKVIFSFSEFSEIAKLFIATIAIIAMITLLCLVLLTIFFTLLIRFLTLGFLIVLMPLIWFARLLPKIDQYWGKWWDAFLKQILFLPTITFFIFLVSRYGDNLKTVVGDKLGKEPGGFATRIDTALNITGFTDIAIRMILVLGFLVGGLKIAKETGNAGTAFALGAANKIKGGTQKYLKGRASALKKTTFGDNKTGEAGAFKKGLAKVPLFKTVLRPFVPGLGKEVKRQKDEQLRASGEGVKKEVRTTRELYTEGSGKGGVVGGLQSVAGGSLKKLFSNSKNKSAKQMAEDAKGSVESVNNLKRIVNSKGEIAKGAAKGLSGVGVGAGIGAAIAGPIGAGIGAIIGATVSSFRTKKRAQAALALALIPKNDDGQVVIKQKVMKTREDGMTGATVRYEVEEVVKVDLGSARKLSEEQRRNFDKVEKAHQSHSDEKDAKKLLERLKKFGLSEGGSKEGGGGGH